MTHALLALAALLSPSDPSIVSSVAAALEAPSTYLAEHAETAERFPELLAPDDERALPWVALVDELRARRIAVEIDWKTDRSDVIGHLRQLAGFRELSLEVRQAVESLALQDGLTVSWLRAVARESQADDVVVATMDIDSDSYVVLLLGSGDYIKAARHARQAGHRLEDIRTHDPNAFAD